MNCSIIPPYKQVMDMGGTWDMEMERFCEKKKNRHGLLDFFTIPDSPLPNFSKTSILPGQRVPGWAGWLASRSKFVGGISDRRGGASPLRYVLLSSAQLGSRQLGLCLAHLGVSAMNTNMNMNMKAFALSGFDQSMRRKEGRKEGSLRNRDDY